MTCSEDQTIDLPVQPDGVPWPTHEWPEGEPVTPDREALLSRVDRLFSDGEHLGRTDALLVVQNGHLVLERYRAGTDRGTTQPSWSMAKSFLHAMVGLAGMHLDLDEPVGDPRWTDPDDPRGAITLDHLLRMVSGLEWLEEYVPGQSSDVIEMLFGSGAGDVAAFAAAKPLVDPPGEKWAYSSGTSNIVAAALGRRLGVDGDRDGYLGELRRLLFEPLGMSSAIPKFDDHGTWIGSSYCFATPRDFARFGLLYLRDGVWEGRRLLPEGWVDHARSLTGPSVGQDDLNYGAHFWLNGDRFGSFSARGFMGQSIRMVPALDLIVIRSGASEESHKESLTAALDELVDAFAEPSREVSQPAGPTEEVRPVL